MTTAKAQEREYTVHEVCAAAGVSVRTVRRYVEHGVVDRPVLRAQATTYTEKMRAQACAAAHLAHREHLWMPQIVERCAGATLDQLRAIYEPGYVPPAAVTAKDAGGAAVGGSAWTHCGLLPGLELMVRADASPFVQRIAREIVQRYQATEEGEKLGA